MKHYNHATSSFAVTQTTNLPWYTEGPAVDKNGNIYFTTLTAGEILKLDTKGQISSWAKAVCPNGQIILPSGEHLVCDSGNQSISRYSTTGEWIGFDIKDECATTKIYKPNDLIADNKGGIYFTDSIRYEGRVFYYNPGGEQQLIAEDLDFPNGLALDVTGQVLYVAESYQNKLLAIDLTTNELQTLCVLPANQSGNIIDNLPDGLAIDAAGNLLVAHYGMGCLQVISTTGEYLRSLQLPFKTPSNCCFSGAHVIISGGHNEEGPGGILKMNYYV